MRNLPKYYWDTSIFSLVLKNERIHGEGVFEAAVEILHRMEKGQAVIITSQILIAEVLPSKYSPSIYERFEAWLQRRNLVIRAVDHPVAKRAGSLRDVCIQRKVRIETPDALHIATALLYEDELEAIHSVDGDFTRAARHANLRVQIEKPKIFIPQPVAAVVQIGPAEQTALVFDDAASAGVEPQTTAIAPIGEAVRAGVAEGATLDASNGGDQSSLDVTVPQIPGASNGNTSLESNGRAASDTAQIHRDTAAESAIPPIPIETPASDSHPTASPSLIHTQPEEV